MSCYLIIPHSHKPHLVMLESEAGWTLPHFVSPEHFWSLIPKYINQAMKEQFDIDVTVLRHLYSKFTPDPKEMQLIHALSNHSPDWTRPDGGRWIAAEMLDDLQLAQPLHRQVQILAQDCLSHTVGRSLSHFCPDADWPR